jgi:hypothetical protein
VPQNRQPKRVLTPPVLIKPDKMQRQPQLLLVQRNHQLTTLLLPLQTPFQTPLLRQAQRL